MRFADDVSARDAYVVQGQLGGVAGAHAKLVEFGDVGDARQIHRHAQHRLVAVGCGAGALVVRVDQQAAPVSLSAVGRPHFAAIDDVVVAVDFGGGEDAGDVTAGTHFAHAKAAQVRDEVWDRLSVRAQQAAATKHMYVCMPLSFVLLQASGISVQEAWLLFSHHATASPAIEGVRNCSRSAGLPNLASAGVAMSV